MNNREQVLEQALRKCYTLAESVSFALGISQSMGSSPKSNTSIVGQVLTCLNELSTIAKEALNFKEPEPLHTTKVSFEESMAKFKLLVEVNSDHKVGLWRREVEQGFEGERVFMQTECDWCKTRLRVDEYGNFQMSNNCMYWQPYYAL